MADPYASCRGGFAILPWRQIDRYGVAGHGVAAEGKPDVVIRHRCRSVRSVASEPGLSRCVDGAAGAGGALGDRGDIEDIVRRPLHHRRQDGVGGVHGAGTDGVDHAATLFGVGPRTGPSDSVNQDLDGPVAVGDPGDHAARRSLVGDVGW
jgi:hypothetical protein